MALLSHPLKTPQRLLGPRRSSLDPPPGAPPPLRLSPGRAAAGALLTIIGVATLAGQIFVFNCGSQACDRAMMTIGLALGAALAALSQLAIILGLWLLWTARRRDA
ncbi:hypothetical protein [Phenylobacterium sp.]|uniref:hypothetical protein n=1 Tax=Phenylobacterium sp. TaxID=1871053 RepID=UPI0025CDE983|nr:hypothetical protein [Phenylobacterium sp.]